MIRSYFGLKTNPFAPEAVSLLAHQQEIHDTLRVHCQQGGLCLLLGEPGCGKSAIKESLKDHDPKRLITPTVSRTLHTYFNILRILCEAFAIDFTGGAFKCEKRLIEEAFRLNQLGKMIVPIVDDAHLMEIESLRKLRLLLEDFPKNHNLILVGQPSLLQNISLSVHQDIKSRVTYSVVLPRLNPEQASEFILAQLDRAGLAHSTFSEEALALIIRSSEGLLRRIRNICLSALLEAVRDQTKKVDLKQVNRVLIQPHWRNQHDELVQN
ncbi:MAG: AAA family ATPase [Lentisphaeria bacterium]|nr:AAA family ATPase [Lentisphaeria bacterium]